MMSFLCFFYIYWLSSYDFLLFLFNDTATTEIYTYLHTLSLHDALPIFFESVRAVEDRAAEEMISCKYPIWSHEPRSLWCASRSEEHTSELQSLMRISYAVFCLKKKNKKTKQLYCCIRIDQQLDHNVCM